MKIEFTLGIDKVKTPVSRATLRLFQQIEDRFHDALTEAPIPELDKILEAGAVVTVSFRKAQ